MPLCPLCQSKYVRLISEERGWGVYKCSPCKFMFGDNSASSDAGVADYGEAYFDPFLARDSNAQTRAGYEAILDRMAKFAPGRRLVDAGSGSSDFAPIARGKGWDPWVVDGAACAVKFLADKHGLPGGVADLNSRDAIVSVCGRERRFDAVNSSHVIEHLKDPRQYLQGCHDVLVPFGILRLACPFYPFRRIASHEFARRIGLMNHHYHFGLPDHVSFFDRSTLARLLRECGFDVLSLEPTAFGSVYELTESSAEGGSLVRKMLRRGALLAAPITKRIGVYHHLEILARKPA